MAQLKSKFLLKLQEQFIELTIKEDEEKRKKYNEYMKNYQKKNYKKNYEYNKRRYKENDEYRKKIIERVNKYRYNKKFIQILPNIFPKDIPIDFHHIDGKWFIVPLPRIIHRRYGGNSSEHIIKNMEWVEFFYDLNPEDFLWDGLH